MKVLVIGGSPRGTRSQTHVLADALRMAAEAKGAAVEVVDLGKARIGFCQAYWQDKGWL